MNHDLYRLYDAEGDLLYIGISADADKRLKQHQTKPEWGDRIESMTTEACGTRERALLAEREAIASEQPTYNILHMERNSKAYLLNKSEVDYVAERAAELSEQSGNVVTEDDVIRLMIDTYRKHCAPKSKGSVTFIGKTIRVNCEECGSKTTVRVAERKRGHGRFCSRSCVARATAKAQKSKKAKNKPINKTRRKQ